MQKTRKRKTKVGTIVYAVLMVLWALALCAGIYYVWTSVQTFGGYWESAQVTPKVDAYIEKLRTEIWEDGENGIVKTISEMEHPYQTDEECVQILKDILGGDFRCVPGISDTTSNRKTYDLLSGRSKFGQVYVTQYPFEPQENKFVNWGIEKFSLYPWEVDGVDFYLDGLYTTFDITVPESFTVLLNGHPLTEENIVETGIRYDVLSAYYDEFDGLPTKVKYHAEKLFGKADYQLLDRNGQPAQIDPERDDSQFIEPVSQDLIERFNGFSEQFVRRYLDFVSGTGDVWYKYGVLQGYVLKGSDLADRLDRTLSSYLEFMHASNFNFNGCTLNSVTPLGNDIYVLDVSADAGSQMPAGYVKVHRDMKIYIKYYPDKDEAFAFSVEDYIADESEHAGN